MPKYLIDSEQLRIILEKSIDIFQIYQFERGYDEPRARTEAVMDVIGTLRALRDDAPGTE